MKPFLLALSFLTRFPEPEYDDVETQDFGLSALFYPAVGLLIGLLLCLPLLIFFNATPLLLAAVLTVTWVLITGGIHLDALVHSADAWIGGFSKGLADEEKTQQILKDSAIGVAGVVSLICVLLLKVVALSVIIKQGGWYYVLLAPAIGRVIILLLFQSTEYVRSTGLCDKIVENLPRNEAGVAIVISCVIAFFISAWGLLFVLTGFWFLRRLMIQRLSGCTAETTGAAVEISEMLWLLGVALFI